VKKTALARGPVKLARQPAQAARKRPKRSGRGNSIPQPSRDAVKARSGGQCELGILGCTGQATDWHHRLRRSSGNHSPANGLHACANCHRFAHAHPAISRLAGWIVPTWETPETTPVPPLARCTPT
jgi:hypothetical protein